MSGTIKTAIKPVVNDFFAVICRMKQILVIVYITAEEFVDSMMSKSSEEYILFIENFLAILIFLCSSGAKLLL